MIRSSLVAIALVFVAFSARAGWTSGTFTLADTFPTTPVEIVVCEDSTGIGTFDLTSVEGDIVDLVPGIAVDWYSDPALTSPISNPEAFVSSDTIVFADIYSEEDSTIRTTEQVTLLVAQSPDFSFLEAVPDTTCGKMPFILGAADSQVHDFTWLPSDFLNRDDVANPFFTPDPDIDLYEYTVIATTSDGRCNDTFDLSFVVLEASLEIEGPDTVETCKSDDPEVTLTALSSDDPANVMWTATLGTLSEDMGASTTLETDLSSTVIAMQEFENGCVLYDTILVRVDSLPLFDITIWEDVHQPCMKYCPGDLVTLSTQPADDESYPDVMYEWGPESFIGQVPDTTGNLAFFTPDGPGKWFTRITTNHACEERDSIFLDIVDTIIDINGIPMERICRGDQFDLMIDDSDWPRLTEVEWSTQDEDYITISCADCQEPTVTISPDAPAGTLAIVVTAIAEECCPATGSAFIPITVPQIPIEPLFVCVGGDGQIFADPDFTDYHWELLSEGGTFDPDNVFNPTVFDVPQGGMDFLVTAVDTGGCPSESRYSVIDTMIPAPSVLPPVVCADVGSGQIIADPTFTYEWNASGDVTIDPTGTEPTISNVSGNGANVQFDAIDANGCIAQGSTFVPTHEDDLLEIIKIDSGNVFTQGGIVNFRAESDPEADPADLIWFHNGDQAPAGGAEFSTIVRLDENEICVELTNSNGCLQRECTFFTGIELEVFIPNAFAPDDQDIEVNRRFQPLDTTREPLASDLIEDFKVFNRWGQLVYNNDDNEDGWDGTQDGAPAPSDAYVYKISIMTDDGVLQTFTGDVSLIR